MQQPDTIDKRCNARLLTKDLYSTRRWRVGGNRRRKQGQVTTTTPHASAMLMEAGQGKSAITATLMRMSLVV
jgi:hypothetical protein